MRLPLHRLTLVLLACLLFSSVPGVWAQTTDEPVERDSSGIDVRSATEVLGKTPFEVDRGPLDRFGWGNLEDTYVQLGAGAAINVFSGNLVISLQPFVRADALPDSQLGLTYSHLDSDGSPELAPGWSYDLGRFWVPGPWGDRVLVDSDGFRDSFFAGEPPTLEKSRRLMEDVVRAWRRQTPLRQRRAAGGESVFRDMVGSDPLFFGEMRMRFLGAPPDPAPSDEDVVWISSRRGLRTMTEDRDDGTVRLSRSDGGFDVFDKEGRLTRVESSSTAPLVVQREGGRISGVEVGGSIRYRIYRDSWERLHRVRSSAGLQTEFEYVGRQLFRLRTPEGDYKFAYDGQGRLLVMDSPRGLIQVRYDGRSGRVAEARGPEGRVVLSDLRGRSPEARVSVVFGESQSSTCSWNSRTRVRRVETEGTVSETRFDTNRPLPLIFREAGREVSFEWNEEGKLLAVRQGDEELRLERDSLGRVETLVAPNGERGSVEQGDSGVLGWRDPEDRSTGVLLDSLGYPKSLSRPGGLNETIWRTKTGQLRSLSHSEGESLEFRRDSRGFLRTVESVESGSAAMKMDAKGRLLRYTAPSGLSTDLRYRSDGSLESFSDGYSTVELNYDRDRQLKSWIGPWERVTLKRDAAGDVVGLNSDEGGGWTLERDKAGRAIRFSPQGGLELAINRDRFGRLVGWERSDGSSTVFDRDTNGRVTGWNDQVTGAVQLRFDRRGYVSEVQRGRGTWRLERDRTGLLTRLVEPSGVATQVLLDSAGRPSTISGPSGLRWRLSHAASGELSGLRSGSESWTLRRGRSGLPREFSTPSEAASSIRWDRAGRWTGIKRSGGNSLTAGYGVLGPTSVGGQRRTYSMDGSLSSWGPIRSGSGWVLDRDAAGRVRSVRWRDPPGTGERVQNPPDRDLQWNEKGQAVELGPWELRWDAVGLRRLELTREGLESRSWEVERDRVGRVTSLEDGEERRAEVTRDGLGDVESFAVDETSWRLERDSAGRVESTEDSSGREWTYGRDAAGRLKRWLRSGEFSLEWLPTDDTAASRDAVLAKANAVEVTDGLPEGGNPSGSTVLRFQLEDGTTALEMEDRRSVDGQSEEVKTRWVPDPWGPEAVNLKSGEGEPLQAPEESSLSPSAEPGSVTEFEPKQLPSDLIGAAIAEAKEDQGFSLTWGSTQVQPLEGDSFLPSAFGRGVGLSSSGWQRLAALSGGTVTWIGDEGRANGLQIPTRGDDWETPESGLGFPAPPATLDPPVYPSMERPANPGAARAVELWWGGFRLRSDSLTRLPRGVSLGDSGEFDARESLQARSTMLPASSAVTGSGVVLPSVPGVSRLIPGPAEREQVSVGELLILSGDLSQDSLVHRSHRASASDAWLIDVPGADLLQDMLLRTTNPSLPPGWRASSIRGLFTGLDGVRLSPDGVLASRDTWTPRAMIQGLPAGVRDVLPGACSDLPGAIGSLPSDGRCTALEGLSDDPLVPGAAVRRVAADDSFLFWLSSLERRSSSDLSGFLPANAKPESWFISTPSGVQVEVDGRGRLLSVSLHASQRRGWARLASVYASSTTLHPGNKLSEQRGELLAPRYLPAPDVRLEARWGLVPSTPDLPIGALGEPRLPALRYLSPLSPLPLEAWKRPGFQSE